MPLEERVIAKYEFISEKNMNYPTTPKLAPGHAVLVMFGQL